MLGRISHWLATRHEGRGGVGDAFVQQRYDTLSRLKNATLAVLRKENAVELSDAEGQQPVAGVGQEENLVAVSLPREQRQQLTERDPCVGELCVALEECLVLGLKPRSDEEQPSWWHVLYASTLIVDEPTLVQSVLSAAFLSETDPGKARCWLKIALNNHTIESSIMIQGAVTIAEEEEEEVIQLPSAIFPHRLKGIKPWQYVFVLSIRLNHLREIVETEGSVPTDLDPQCAGALLLDFLKNLPDSLLTDEKYDAFVAAGQLRDEDASVRNITCLTRGPACHLIARVGERILSIKMYDALERLEAKKEAMRMVSHQMKLQPQMNFLSDRQQVNEITRLFRAHLEGGNNSSVAPDNSVVAQVAECSKSNTAVNLELHLLGTTIATPVGSATSSGASSPTTSETTEQDRVIIWEHFGFNRQTILGNFDKGGVLMLRAILYWLKNDPGALPLLKMRALPSELPSYDAGLVASSICESLVKVLKLFVTPKHPEIDIVTMSLEPFWELFDEDMYFSKLFMFMFQVFDQLWSELDPKAASFTRVITETEGIMNELLKKAPVTVNDMRMEWGEIRTRRLEEVEEEEEEEEEEQGGVEANGSSLETLLILAQKQSPTLLVVKDTEGNVFGGFASDEWHRAFHYYGTGESFLFSFANTSAAGGFVKYHWSRKNSYFMLCSDESLIMGGGGNFGLFLDSDLSAGTSGACETFNSPPLTTSPEFSCVQVELWGFTTGDKPLAIDRHRKSVLE
uniref:Oxidation resistance protein 1 n=1 Tax=Phytophthora ramorum TaxID=164328 RepID=H3HAP7_PHYRM